MLKKQLGFIVIILFYNTAFAGFPIGKGRGMLVPSYNFYSARGYWDRSRNYVEFPNNGRFTSHYFSVFGGFGISRKLDFVFNVPLVGQVRTENNLIKSNWGLGDVSLGLSYFFTEMDAQNHISLTGSLIVPLYQNGTEPFIGFQKFGSEVKLGFSGSANRWTRNPYYDAELGFRQFFDRHGPTQIFFNITGGVPVSEKVKISGTIGGFNSQSSDPNQLFNANNLFANKQFDFLRATAAVGYSITANTAIWANIFTDITGSNIGRGSGFALFAVIKF
jgi:protein XagA